MSRRCNPRAKVVPVTPRPRESLVFRSSKPPVSRQSGPLSQVVSLSVHTVPTGRPGNPLERKARDSRGRWEGNTLVVDVTNFSGKTSFNGSRENLHVVERWTRLDADTIEYQATVEDPTVWTRPWTVKFELYKQDDAANRFYTEPRCFEGNYGFPAMLLGERLVELAYAEGRGPHPATKDNATCDGGEGLDALGKKWA